MLNCMEGDRAVVIRGPFMGFIVTVGKYLGDTDTVTMDGKAMYSGDTWIISNPWIVATHHDCETVMRDASLQPIRGLRNGLLTKEKRA